MFFEPLKTPSLSPGKLVKQMLHTTPAMTFAAFRYVNLVGRKHTDSAALLPHSAVVS